MNTTNYTETLILPSPDCAASSGMVPGKPGTIGALQHERLSASPYEMTSDELLFGIHVDRQEIAVDDREDAREAFFSKGQACLRASPLVKTFGWALHHDAQARVALVDPASETFAMLQARDDVTKLSGMRSKKA